MLPDGGEEAGHAFLQAPDARLDLGRPGADVATIGRILGHRPGSVVTLRYLHTDDSRLRRAADAVAVAVQRV